MQGFSTETRLEKDALEHTIHKAVQRLMESQDKGGFWAECFDTGVMPDAQTVVYLHLLGVNDTEWTDPLLERILSNQRENGAWGVYPGDEGDLSTSVECYYALQLYGRWDNHTEKKSLAKHFILRNGGLKRCRNLTKILLAIGDEIPWSWLPSPRLYLLLFSDWSPLSIWDIVTFTRLHIPPMLALSTFEYVEHSNEAPILRELVPEAQQRNLRFLSRGCFGRRPTSNMLHRLFRCLKWMLEKREEDGTAAGYHSSTFLIIFALRALGYEKNHPEIQALLHAMRKSLFVDPETGYAHQQTCDAHVWNTALSVKALQASRMMPQPSAVRKAIRYLVSKQHRTVGEWVIKNSSPPGGWAFSSNNTTHPDIDDTVACLEVLFPFRLEHEQVWQKGVHWLMGMQNKDGGWSAFEKDCNKRWLEWIPANDMRRAMYDPSTPDITARVVEFLIHHQVLPLDDSKINRAIRWLRKHQEPDGSWFGRWGTTYIYGTWCAIKALTAAEVSSGDETMRKAKEWLLGVQRVDGSFGESCQSDLQGRFVPLNKGLPTQTAWGLDALLHLYQMEESHREQRRLQRACRKAADWLLAQADNGAWREDVPTGSAFPGALHIRYHIYPKVWPIMALSHYRSVESLLAVKGGETDAGSEASEYVPW
ncbi:prenyltransferase/squalene oxidase repeat-containing protein [Alicyclobacillus ferrooxydans]|uniref:Squalene-hopene cyclase n=1 Tax=Alicyclobacillus ferrooxydans TaxID=471514 RepID=A0A0N8PPZ5_9BACL|nr:prenyltransferase/squalene oxidase repeat-containing protein [Alicyclobacillus ferrooxydans]KPV45701.1 hypothetical protein AN477_02010 [Alicyclobacillus ferrooxydans]